MKNLVVNANSRTLDQTNPTLPNMQDTLSNWFQNIVFILIKKTTENFQVVEKEVPISFEGVVESVTPTDLQMRPDGQRKWSYISVWSTPELVLQVDDIFRYQQKNYRVLSKTDWAVYGYVQYECTEDYTR